MKNTTRALNFMLPILLMSLIVGCSNSNSSVSLRDGGTPPPSTGNGPSEKPGAPNPTPTPGDNTPDNPGTQPTPAPTPTPAATRVARFICESELQNARSFNTIRGDAVSNYMMPSLIPTVNGHSVNYAKSPVPLSSNGTTVTFLLRAQEDDFTPWKVYKATGNLLSSSANLQVLSSYQGVPPKGGYAYENLKLDRRILAANSKRSAYLYPTSSGTYTWESLKGSSFTVPFNADSAFNPTFIGGDDYLRFDQERNGGPTLTQKFYSFNSKKTISLPSPADSRDNQLFGYINAQKTTVFWVEGRPEGTWKVRAMGLSSGKSSTLGTLPGTSAAFRLPMVFVDYQGESLLAYNEEQVGADKNGNAVLKTAVIHLVKVSSKLMKITGDKTIPYSDELKTSASTPQALAEGILSGLLFEPISGDLYAPILTAGGLASFGLESNTWKTHGMVAKVYGCFNPEWGVEVTTNE